MERLDATTRVRYELRARVFKALAHPTRLFIVEQLAGGERCVCELVRMIDADVSTISKHLAVLLNAGIAAESGVARTCTPGPGSRAGSARRTGTCG